MSDPRATGTPPAGRPASPTASPAANLSARSDPEGYVRGNTVLQAPPLVPEIRLHLADERAPLWSKTQRDLYDDGIVMPYWAFAWAGGQALARLVLDEPWRVAGKRVVDFASGSAIAGIAAMRAGARHVLAADIDPLAATAARLNAAANGVIIATTDDDLVGREMAEFDVILAGDICYEQSVAQAVTAWLAREARAGRTVLVGDPGRTFLPRAQLAPVVGYGVKSARDLDDTDVRNARVWQFSG